MTARGRGEGPQAPPAGEAAPDPSASEPSAHSAPSAQHPAPRHGDPTQAAPDLGTYPAPSAQQPAPDLGTHPAPSAQQPAPAEGLPSMTRYIELQAGRFVRMVGGRIERGDLVSAGHVGLLEAQQRFNPRIGVPFFAFARHRVRGAMFDTLRAAGLWRQRRQHPELNDAWLSFDAAGPPAAEVIDAQTGAPDAAQDAQVVFDTIARVATALWVDDLAQLPDPDADPEAQLEATQARTQLDALLQAVPSEERLVLDAVYDLQQRGDSGAQLAKRLGLSRSQISRRHLRALDRLRRLMAVDHPDPPHSEHG